MRARPDPDRLKRKLDEAQAAQEPEQEPDIEQDEGPQLKYPFPDERANNPGRPPWEPEEWHRKVAEELAGFGIAMVDIARIIGVSEPLLMRHLSHEIEQGRAMAHALAGRYLFDHIKKGNFLALQFYMRVQMRWIEPKQGDDAPEKEIEQLSDDDIRREIEAIAARERTAAQARSLAPRMQV